MSKRQDGGSGEETSGWVHTDVAAEALGVSARSVRNYILNGDLVARKEKEGINERYVVSVDSLYALRDRRKQEGKMRGNLRDASRRSEGSTEGTAEAVKEIAVDMLRETLASLETHIAHKAELRAESTLREELERERRLRHADVERVRSERLQAQERAEQLEQESARLKAERRRAEEEAQNLREELEAEQAKGFWRRLFGG